MKSNLEKELPKIQNHISEWFTIIVPLEDLKAALEPLVESHEDFRNEIADQSWGDTFVREIIIDAIIERFVGEEFYWPCNGDSQEYKDSFYKNLAGVIKARSWSLTDENN